MKDSEIDEVLQRSAQAPHHVEARVLGRIEEGIASSSHPVRPVANRWVLVGALAAANTAVALIGGATAGFQGVQQMDGWKRGLIFPGLLLLAVLAGGSYASTMIPGSRRMMSPASLLVVTCLGLACVFAGTFHDYVTEGFVSQGVDCLKAGVAHAVPASVCGWFVLRRGWAINRIAAGISAGILAGLAGLALLELHCPSGQVLHVLVWHIGVVASCAAGGMCVTKIAS